MHLVGAGQLLLLDRLTNVKQFYSTEKILRAEMDVQEYNQYTA